MLDIWAKEERVDIDTMYNFAILLMEGERVWVSISNGQRSSMKGRYRKEDMLVQCEIFLFYKWRAEKESLLMRDD